MAQRKPLEELTLMDHYSIPTVTNKSSFPHSTVWKFLL